MEIPWNEVDQLLSGLSTDVPHQVQVRREAIPIIFVPGIMGSRLRVPGTNGEGEGPDGLPNLRWEPEPGWLFWNCSGKEPAHRKALLIGARFDPDYLEVDNDTPVGNGFRGIMKAYRAYLEQLRDRDWGALGKLFEFPVYAFGYNWTGDAKVAGAKLVARIDEIIAEARQVTGRCEKVILVSHSMGGLVTRAASKLAGGEGRILGIVHGVQPAWGAAAAYWRIKAGFEGGGIVGRLTSRFLGSSGEHTTIILGNSIGGLELLPSRLYSRNDGVKPWLYVTEDGKTLMSLPRDPASPDPFTDIYRVPAQVKKPKTGRPSTNTWWGLVDPDLLAPGNDPEVFAPNPMDDKADSVSSPWASYLDLLAQAEAFQTALGPYTHPQTFSFHGAGLPTAEYIHFACESNWVWSDPYRTRGFLGFYRNAKGEDMQAVLQDPAGGGDGTVPVSSATFLGVPTPTPDSPPAAQQAFHHLEHQPAYEDAAARRYATAAITALVAVRYKALRGA